jgi:hypothetical protein
MIAWLLQEVKEVLAGNVFEKQKEIRRGFEGTIQRDDVGVGWQRLVNRCLEHLRAQSVLVEIGLGQAFESVFTAVPNRSWTGGDVIKVDGADRREIFGCWLVPRQDLTDLVDDSVTSGAKGLDNLKLDGRGIEIVVAVVMAEGNGEKSNSFTLEVETLTDNITWEENVLDRRGMSGNGPRVLEGDIGAGGVEGRKNGGTWKGAWGWETGGVWRKRNGRGLGRSSDRGGRIDGEHVVVCPRGTICGQMATSTIGRLSGGERLGLLWAEGEVGHGYGILQHCWTGKGD